MSGGRCVIPGCGAALITAFPLCVAHFFNVPAAARHAYFEALEAKARVAPSGAHSRDGRAAEERFQAAYEAVVALAAPNGRLAGRALR